MGITEKLHESIERLPASLQAEALDFVEFLIAKAEQEETKNWDDLSLHAAMRGMEAEAGPTYTQDDIKEVFR
jgi:hypothetical protein